MNICLIGTFPPPIGGTSIHVRNLFDKLKKDVDFNVRLLDTYAVFATKDYPSADIYPAYGTRNLFSQLLRQITWIDVIHYHGKSSIILSFLFFISIVFRKRLVVTFHSFRSGDGSLTRINPLLRGFLLNGIHDIIATGENVMESLVESGARKAAISIIPSYINIVFKESTPNIKSLSDQLLQGDLEKTIFIANASNNNFYNGIDLYGIDICIDLCMHLSKSGFNILFIFVLTNITEPGYYEELIKKISDNNLTEKFLLYIEEVNYRELMGAADIVVRPTCYDTTSLTIYEAISAGKIVIASDVCARPIGTITFRNRDLEDFFEKTISVLNDLDAHKKRAQKNRVDDYYIQIKSIYTKNTNNDKTTENR